MKIALDLRRINNPGIGRYMKCLTEALVSRAQKRDDDHEYLLILPPGSEDAVAAHSGRVEKISSPIKYYSVHEQIELPRMLRQHKVDLLHSPHFNLPLIRVCPTVVTLHDVIYLACKQDLPSRVGRLYYRAMMSAAARRADRIITVSHFSKRDIVKYLGVNPAKIDVIHSGLAGEFQPVGDGPDCQSGVPGAPGVGARGWESILAKYGIQIDVPYILYTGIYKPRKNHAGLIHAFQRLLLAGVKAQLVIAGPMNEGKQKLRALARELGVAGEVVFTGFVPDQHLLALYSAARLYACPSLYEGFGFTVLEAMACGVPVVCSPETSLPEVAGEAALYADPRDPQEFAAALERAFSDMDLRHQMIDKGHDNQQRFTWESAVTSTLAVYERAAGAGRVGVEDHAQEPDPSAKTPVHRDEPAAEAAYSAVAPNARQFSLSQVVRRLSRMAILFVAARMLGVETFGAYALLLTVVEMVAMVSGFAYTDFLTREVAKRPDAAMPLAIRMTLLRLTFLVPSLCVAVLVLAALRFPLPTLLNMALLATTLVPRAAGESAQGILRGIQRFAPLPWMEFLQGVTVLASAIVLVGMGFGLRGVIAGEVLGAVAAAIFAISSLGRRLSFSGSKVPGLIALVRLTFAFNVYPFIANIYDRVDVVLLSKLAGNFATGIYSIPYRAVGTLQIIPSSVMGALLPVLSSSGVDRGARERCETAMKFFYLGGLLIALATLAFAGPVLLFILGASFSDSVTALEILVWGAVPTFLNLALNTVLLATRREKIFLWTATVCTIFNIAANLILIPRFSFRAAAAVTVATEYLLLAQNLYLVRRFLGQALLPKDWGWITVAFTAVMASFWGLQRGVPQVWAGLVALSAFAIFSIWSAAGLRQLRGQAEGEPAK
jgi:glycosyltransferase involved in cell wall biosynthesis/O-antigen/teichoic acid export membrane protein